MTAVLMPMSTVRIMSSRKKVAIGMSGGVDSSVAASVLLESGYDVIGINMLLWQNKNAVSNDAKTVCDRLGIKLHTLDFCDEFSKSVIDYFTDEYIKGRTPNPCIVCNKLLKFDAMAKAAKALGADYIATGHYAKIEKCEETGRYILKRATADKKDQTYALYSLNQEQLSHLLLPLGDFENKDKVREYAKEHGLVTADKPDSQEICFIPDNDYSEFIKRRTGNVPKEGNFVDKDGNILGIHKGIINYTVGQRKGLGIAFGKPMFVTHIDAEKNEVVLGEQGTEFSDTLYADRVNFIPFDKLSGPMRVKAKVRYAANPADCTVSDEGERIKVVFDEPQRAITPGQAVVFYDGDIVVGGGTIL